MTGPPSDHAPSQTEAKTPKSKARRVLLAVAVFVGWYAVGYFWNGTAIEFLIVAFMGGYSEPPAIWMLAHRFGLYVLPYLTVLGGLPTAIDIVREKAFYRTFFLSVASIVGAWAVVFFTLFYLPNLMGWHW